MIGRLKVRAVNGLVPVQGESLRHRHMLVGALVEFDASGLPPGTSRHPVKEPQWLDIQSDCRRSG